MGSYGFKKWRGFDAPLGMIDKLRVMRNGMTYAKGKKQPIGTLKNGLLLGRGAWRQGVLPSGPKHFLKASEVFLLLWKGS